MLRLAPEHHARAAALYAAAMSADPLHLHFFPDPARRSEQMHALYGFKVAESAGMLYAPTPALEACAIWAPPRGSRQARPRTGLLAPLLRLLAAVPLGALGRMLRYDRFARALHRALLPAPHWYLDLIAVAPEHRGRGLAGQLIRPILDRADAAGLPCYLETQNPRNLAIYARYGFTVLRAAALPDTALTHYAMLRPPGAAGGEER